MQVVLFFLPGLAYHLPETITTLLDLGAGFLYLHSLSWEVPEVEQKNSKQGKKQKKLSEDKTVEQTELEKEALSGVFQRVTKDFFLEESEDRKSIWKRSFLLWLLPNQSLEGGLKNHKHCNFSLSKSSTNCTFCRTHSIRPNYIPSSSPTHLHLGFRRSQQRNSKIVAQRWKPFRLVKRLPLDI